MKLPVVRWLVVLLLAAPGLAAAQLQPAWTNVGPPGGAVGGVIADPADARHVFVLDNQGLVLESRDRGASWRPTATRACPASEGQMLGGALYVVCNYSVLRSSDGGNSWSPFVVATPAVNASTVVLALDPAASGSAIAVSFPFGPYITGNSGRSWTSAASATPVASTAIAFDPSQARRVVSVIASGSPNPDRTTAWQSSDGGSTWSALGTVQVWAPGTTCFPRRLALERDGTMYLVTDCGLQVSRDGGSTWSLQPASALGVTFIANTKVLADPLRPGHAIAFDAQVFETQDRGASWSHAPLAQGIVTSLSLAADGAVWAVAGGTLVRRDSADGSWTEVAIDVLRSSGVLSVLAAGSDGRVLMTESKRSTDGGATWSASDVHGALPVAGQPSQFYAVHGASTIAASTLLFSADAGATWSDTGFALATSDGKPVGALAPAGPQPGLIYAATLQLSCMFDLCGYVPGSVVRSGDGGRTWAPLAQAPAGVAGALVASPANPRVVYASTSAGLYRSTDAGDSWTLVRADRVDQVVPDASDAASVYVRASGGVFASFDGGQQWQALVLPSVRAGVPTFAADPVSGGRLYLAGPDGAAFESLDRGASWHQLSLGDPAAGTNPPSLGVAVNGTQRRLLRVANLTVYALDVVPSPLVLDTDLWWNPAESGWGMSIAQHADGQLFAVWYHYDAQGKPTWAVVSGGSWSDAATFKGPLYATHAAPFFAGPFDSTSVQVRPIGALTLHFADANAATMAIDFADGSARFERTLVRQRYGPPAQSPFDLGALWWNPLESGWGIAMNQQYATVFATWFVYDAQGEPTWLVAPDLRLGGATGGFYPADLYATSGPPFPGPFDASKVTATKVGTITWITGATSAWLRYSAYGATRDVPMSRQPF